MTEAETMELLLRMYAIWPAAMPPENRRKLVREEWQRLLGRSSAQLLNEALDRYASSPAGKYMPKPGELLEIGDNILEERRRQNALSPGRCPLCGDSKYVLLQYDGENLFYDNYAVLGLKCPCERPGEMAALRRGLKLSRQVKQGMLEIWLENDRLTGRLRLFKQPGASPPEADAEAAAKRPTNGRPDKLQNAFSGLKIKD